MKLQENIAREFDLFSNDYTRDMTNCVPYYVPLMRSIVDSVPTEFGPRRILDLGCGNGNLTGMILERFPDARYTLVDASPEMLRICRERFPDADLDFFEAYFKDYHFEPGSFDMVTGSFSLHHIDSAEKEELFKEIYLGLRTGGLFASCDLMIHKSHSDHPALLAEWDAFVNGNHDDGEKWKWIMEHYDAFDRPDHYEDQIRWLEEAGFSSVRITFQKGYWISLQATK